MSLIESRSVVNPRGDGAANDLLEDSAALRVVRETELRAIGLDGVAEPVHGVVLNRG